MKTFKNAMRVAFVGRLAGAIGVEYAMQDTVEYDATDSMKLALYEGRTGSGQRYDSVMQFRELDRIYTENDLTRINNDSNGNPRYVIHFLALLTEQERAENRLDARYDYAVKKARKLIGGKKFHNKQYGGGIVFSSYSVYDELALINAMHRDAVK